MSIKSVLYEHVKHQHTPRNVNEVHAAERTGLNARIAVALTKGVGTMWTAYFFVLLALIGLLGLLNLLNPITFLLATWVSQQFLQLVLLPVIMVGQNVLSRKQELQIDEMDETSQHSFHDIEAIAAHLSSQDEELLKQTRLLEQVETTEVLKLLSALMDKVQNLEAHLAQQNTSTTSTKRRAPQSGI